MTTVIKPGTDYELLAAAMPLHLSEHVAEADALVSQAREQAKRIVAEAKKVARRPPAERTVCPSRSMDRNVLSPGIKNDPTKCGSASVRKPTRF